MKHLTISFLLALTALGVALPATSAESDDPVAFVENITKTMLEELNTKRDILKQEPEKILDIVDRVVMPHIAAKTIARKVMGKYWRIASEEQQEKFTVEFTTYLKRYYSKAFLSYNNQRIEYEPKPKWVSPKTATVTSHLLQDGQQPVEIVYKIQKSKNGWLVTDIVIEGISLVINNQRQYGSLFANEGIDTVIAKLAYNNAKAFE
jgi:phospholipid transport system substrate-binding protein